MAEIVNSLFGVTPESLQMQRQALLDKQAMDYASLDDPYKQANYGIYKGIGNLAQGIGGLLGAQDPEMMRMQQRQQLIKNIDQNDPDSILKAAQAANAAGDSPAAMELFKRYQDLRTSNAGIAEKQANVAAKLREGMTNEQKNAQALADASGLERGSAEWQSAYSKALKGLTDKNEPTAVVETADGVFLVNKVDGKRISRIGSAPERGTKVYNSMEGLDKAITAVTGKGMGEEIAKLGQSVSGLSKFERAVSDVETLLPNSFTGLGAGTLTQLNKAAAAVGASKGEKASNTEILTNTFNNIVLPMARQLPGSLAAKELTFLLTTKPATEQEPATIRRLMKQMLQDYRADKTAYEASQRHQAANKGSYAGFDINAARYNAGRIADLTQRVKENTASIEEAQELKKLRSEQ